MTQRIAFTLPLLLPLPNRRRGTHWAVLSKERKRLATEIWAALGTQQPAQPLARARVTIWRHSVQEPDTDNLYASCKGVLDALQPATERRTYGLGVITDDRPSLCDLRAKWVKAAHRTDQRTVVEVVEWLDAVTA